MIVQPFSFLQGSAGGGGGIPTANLLSDFDPAVDVFDSNGDPITDADYIYEWHGNGSTNNIARQTASNDQLRWLESGPEGSGQSCVEGFGGSSGMEVLNSVGDYNSNDITFYAVADWDTGNENEAIWSNNSSGGAFGYDDGWWVGAGTSSDERHKTYVDNMSNASGYTIINTSGNNQLQVRGFRFKTSSGTQYNNNKVQDGTQDTANTLVASNYTKNTTKNSLIMANYDGSGNWPSNGFDGKVYRILVYGTYHDDTTYNNILQELEDTYL